MSTKQHVRESTLQLPYFNLHFHETPHEDKSKPISCYPIPYKRAMPFDIVALIKVTEKKTRYFPNVFKVLSYQPSEFRAFFAYYSTICNKETVHVSRADEELLTVVTSLAKRHPYNVVVHGTQYRVYSKNPVLSDQVCVNWGLTSVLCIRQY